MLDFFDGDEGTLIDPLVEAEIGQDEAARIHAKCVDVQDSRSECSECVKCIEVGMTDVHPEQYLIDWWYKKGLQKLVPEILEFGNEAILLDMAPSNNDYKPKIQRIMEILEIFVRYGCSFNGDIELYHVYAFNMPMIKGYCMHGISGMKGAWQSLPEKEQTRIKKFVHAKRNNDNLDKQEEGHLITTNDLIKCISM